MPKKNQYLEHLQLYGETEVPAQDITSLKKYYGSLAEALDSTSSELGSRYHKVTKIQTIKKRNKKKSITSVQEIFQSQTVLNEKESETQKKIDTLQLISSDRDVAQIMIEIIHSYFYDSENGFWLSYDESFPFENFPIIDKSKESLGDFTQREEMNHLMNIEVGKIMETEFVHKTIQNTLQQVIAIIYGVKLKDVIHAVRNHVRDHLSTLLCQN